MPLPISDRLERISAQLSQAITAAVPVPADRHHDESILPDILYSLTTWKSRPSFFAKMAYEWCSVICERYPDFKDEGGRGRKPLFRFLEVGFHHLNFRDKTRKSDSLTRSTTRAWSK